MVKDYEVHINRRLAQDIVDIYLIHKGPPRSYLISAGDGVVRREIINEELAMTGKGGVRPFLSLFGSDTAALEGLHAALSSFLGKPDETFVRGKLEATERYLADMRFIAGLVPGARLWKK